MIVSIFRKTKFYLKKLVMFEPNGLIFFNHILLNYILFKNKNIPLDSKAFICYLNNKN